MHNRNNSYTVFTSDLSSEIALKMDTNEFLEYGKKTIEFIANYRQDLPNMSVISEMEPGYLAKALPGN